MKPNFRLTALVALLLPMGGELQAGEDCTLETHVYVFRNSDFQAVKMLSDTVRSETRGMILRAPATIHFDEETLSLDGAKFTWSGGRNPPDHFSRISTPTVPLAPGKPVTLLSTAPVQFLEKIADGTLQVREIASDSPDAPHCRLTFTMKATGDADDDRPLTCELDVATVSARESVAGVTLEVGRPVLARFNEQLAFNMRPQEWSALLVRSPNGSDHSLLVLLKIAPSGAPGTGVAAEQSGQFMTAEELDQFATNYYRKPQPELVARAIAVLGPSGFLKDRANVFVGFFAEIFAANPTRMAEWRTVTDQQDRPTRDCLRDARQLSRRGAVLAVEAPSVRLNDMCWGAFFASGDPAYLRKLAEQLRFIDVGAYFWIGATAKWSLARNAPEHPLVRTTLEGVRTETDRRTREIIGDVLTKDLSVIRGELLEMSTHVRRPGSQESRPAENVSGYQGLRDGGDFGPVNPNQEMGTRQ